jgi:hypothetical protein
VRETLALRQRTVGENHPHTAYAIYILSTVAARHVRRDEALRMFRDAVDHGFRQSEEIIDQYWKSFRGDPRFEALVAEVRNRAAVARAPK